MAAMAPSGVTKRTKAHAWPLRLPPRMRKTSSTSPWSWAVGAKAVRAKAGVRRRRCEREGAGPRA